MDVGLVPFHRVGAHRRIPLADALALDTEDLERTYGL
jgi:hypothetical protein